MAATYTSKELTILVSGHLHGGIGSPKIHIPVGLFETAGLTNPLFQGVIRASEHCLCFLFRDNNPKRYMGLLASLIDKEPFGFILLKGSEGKGMIFKQCALGPDLRYLLVTCQVDHLKHDVYVMKVENIQDYRGPGRVRKLLEFSNVIHCHSNLASDGNLACGVSVAFLPSCDTTNYLLFNAVDWPKEGNTSHVASLSINSHTVDHRIEDLGLYEPGRMWRIRNHIFTRDGSLLLICLESIHDGTCKKARYIVVDSRNLQVLCRISNTFRIDRWRISNCAYCYTNLTPALSKIQLQMAALASEPPEGEEEDTEAGTPEERVVLSKMTADLVQVYRLPRLMTSLQSLCKMIILGQLSSVLAVRQLPLPPRVQLYLEV